MNAAHITHQRIAAVLDPRCASLMILWHFSLALLDALRQNTKLCAEMGG